MHAAMVRCYVVAALAVLTLGVSARAQRVPDLGYCYPPGGQAGTTVEVRLGGYDWTPDMQFFVLDRRIQLVATGPPGELLIPPPPYWFGPKSKIPALPVPREVPAKFIIPADVPPGPIRWQAANANGATATGLFIVSGGPEIVEDERRKVPQPLTSLPVTVSGRILKIEEIDRYRFSVPKTGPVTCELMARRLGANFHGVLEVRDTAGRLVADAVDTEGLDTGLTFTARAGVDYVVSVRDIDFAGDRSFVYRLSITPGPRVVAAIPAAGRRGETRPVEFVGLGVATGEPKLESVTRQVTFPKDAAAASLAYQLETPFGTALAFPLLVSDLPETVTPPRTAEKVHRLHGPVAVTGVLDQPDAEDRYLWETKKGELWSFAVEARRIGSPLDVALALLGPDGKELARNDDLPGTTDAGLSFTAPADGTYQLVVSDQAGKSGSRAAVYRMVVQWPASGFALEVAQQRLSVPIGGKVDLAVKATRQGGFHGPITLAVAGLPPGVSVPAALVIPADKSDLVIPLVSAKDAPAAASLVSVTGTGQVGTATVTHTARVPSPGSLAPRSPDENHVAAILVAGTMKPRCKGSPVDKDTGRKVHRGTTFPAEVVLERLEGYTGEILLQMAARQSYQVQGITGGDVLVPPAVTRTVYPCFMPEWLETSRTSRMAMIAVVKVPDPRGNVRHLVVELEGMVTMSMEGAILKVSHEPREVTAQPGQAFAVRVQIARSPELPEPVRLELRLSDELAGLLTAEAAVVPAGQGEAAFAIAAKNDPRLIGAHMIVIRATALQNGRLPVISETTVPVEFVSGAGKGAR
jgi:hypothetical protein